MGTDFNFTKLHPLFLEAIKRHELSIAFPMQNGNGRFVFLLFMLTDKNGNIQWGELELFIILGNTQKILRLKLYGNL